MSKFALQTLPRRVRQKRFILCVVGLGRVGLPLAAVFAHKGVNVIGVDNDMQRLNKIKQFKCPFHDPELQQILDLPLVQSHLSFVGNLEVASSKSDIILITVGTPINQYLLPDCSFLNAAFESISKAGLTGKAVLLRSTVPPRFTADLIQFLKKKQHLEVGVDFALAMCPERILEGRAIDEIRSLPEIVGAVDVLSSEIAAQLTAIELLCR